MFCSGLWHCLVWWQEGHLRNLCHLPPRFFCGWLWMSKKVKVKIPHTCYRALGPGLIPVYKQSSNRWLWVIHTVVGCQYFPPGLRLPSQPQTVTASWPVLSYTARWQAHRCEQLAQGCYAALPRVGFEPMTCWSQVLRSTHCATAPPTSGWVHDNNDNNNSSNSSSSSNNNNK